MESSCGCGSRAGSRAGSRPGSRAGSRPSVWMMPVVLFVLSGGSGALAQRFGRPNQQNPYPGQEYPGQQYPGHQYPGQQYPGQYYPGQQYPGQRQPPPSLDSGPGFGGGNFPFGDPGGDDDGVLGGPCEYDEHCYSVEHTFCLNHKSCECKRGFVRSPAGDRCLATVGVSCSTKYDCAGLGRAGGPAGECRQGVCDCGDRDVPAPDGSCVRGALKLSDACQEDLQCQTLGDGVVCAGGSCQCAPQRHAHHDRCIPDHALHQPCTEDAECVIGKEHQAIVGCHPSTRTCQCSEHYVEDQGQCIAGVNGMKSVPASIILAPIIIRYFV